MRIPFLAGAIGAIVLAAALGCGPKQAAISPKYICSNLKPQGDPADTVTVALFEDVDPRHAPMWRNDAERLVFNHLYETLAAGWDAGCLSRGPLRLVESAVASGQKHTYTLRADARFWDGAPVTAQDVAECTRAGIGTSIGIDSVVVLDDRRVCVFASRPAMLESFSRAVVRRTPDGFWPMGSGPYMVERNESLSDGEIILTPVIDTGGPVLQFVDARGIDARDVIDQAAKSGVDLLVLRDREVIDYAASLGQFEKLPLTWSRAYMLISVSRAEAIDRGSSLPALTSVFQSAVRGAVRNAYAGGWSEPEWDEAGRWCRSTSMPVAASPTHSRRIVYDSGDTIARDLADRIVSLAAGDTALANAVPGIVDERSKLVSIGLSSQELANSLRYGADFAYVIGIHYEMADFCPAMSDLLEAAPWLAGDRFAEKVLPLTKTGSVPVVRRPSAGFGFDVRTDDFGNLVIVRRNSAAQP